MQLQLRYTNYTTPQLQLHYTTTTTTATLHPAVVGEVTDQVTIATIATTSKNTAPTTFRSISGFALPSEIHNNQPLLQVSYFWNFRHRLVRYYWYVEVRVKQTRRDAVVDCNTMQSNVLKITKRQATVLLPGNNSFNFFQVLRFDAPKVFARQRLRPGQAMGHCKLQPLQTHLQMVVAKGQRKLDGRYRQDLTGCNSCFQPRGSINFHQFPSISINVMKFPSISMSFPVDLPELQNLAFSVAILENAREIIFGMPHMSPKNMLPLSSKRLLAWE